MIYLYQNKEEYDYDVRAIALAFYEREKIIAVPEEEMDRLASEEQGEENVRFLSLIYEEGKISGRLFDREGKEAKQEVCCAYHDHEKSRNAVCRFLYRLFSEFTGRTLPWGMLTGIRPTKIVMKWMEETTDVQRESLEKRFSETYLADAQKAHLCVQVAEREKRFLESHPYEEEYSLYIGIPFCPTTCLYCSFASFPVERFGDRIAAYMQALTKEMEFVAQACAQKRLTSIYVGGGTPTALDEDSLQYLMEQIHRLFPVEKTREFTVEAGRPDSVTRKKLQILYDAGVGRISINPQTMHDETLRLIGRNHTVQQVNSRPRHIHQAVHRYRDGTVVAGGFHQTGDDADHHGGAVNDLGRVVADHVDAQHAVVLGVNNNLADAVAALVFRNISSAVFQRDRSADSVQSLGFDAF